MMLPRDCPANGPPAPPSVTACMTGEAPAVVMGAFQEARKAFGSTPPALPLTDVPLMKKPFERLKRSRGGEPRGE